MEGTINESPPLKRRRQGDDTVQVTSVRSVVNDVTDAPYTWEELKEIYKADNKIRDFENTHTTPEHLLQMLRGMSKVYIDTKVYEHKQTLKEDLRAYVFAAAFGSTKVTSDYDVQLTGPRVYRLCERIIKDTTPNSKSLNGEWELARKFDSNVYIAPYASYAPNVFCTPHPNEIVLTDSKKMYLPLPTFSNKGIDKEIAQIKKRLECQDSGIWKLTDNYDEMISYGKELDAFYYTEHKGSSCVQALEENFWDCLHRVMFHATEAMCTVSGFLCVVHIIQGHKNDTIAIQEHLKNVDKMIRYIAMLENILEYSYHTKFPSSAIIDPFQKYLDRIEYIRDSLEDDTIPEEHSDCKKWIQKELGIL